MYCMTCGNAIVSVEAGCDNCKKKPDFFDAAKSVVTKTQPRTLLLTVLYILSFTMAGSIVAFFFAYFARKAIRHGDAYISSHYVFIISLFKKAAAFIFLSVIMVLVLGFTVGGPILGMAYVAFFVWYYVRLIAATLLMRRGKPISNPTTWLIPLGKSTETVSIYND